MKTKFIQLMLCIALVAFGNSSKAANYYFSTESGNDSRSATQAQNPSSPWKTIKKLNAIFNSLKPGDKVLFKRGETFYGSIYITKSGAPERPIMISAYGSGAKPVITSLIRLKTWTPVGKGIYASTAASLPESRVNILLLNNDIQEMGRFPNRNTNDKGYRNIDAHSGNSSITDKSLSSFPNWTGAEVVIRKTYWIIDKHKITSHSGNLITYAPTAGSSYSPKDDFGYFIQDHIKTLDNMGEWYYDPKSKKMNVFFGSKSPSSYDIQVSTLDYLVANSSYIIKYVTFDNLHFKGANKDALHLKGGNDVLIQNCEIQFSGLNGLSTEGTSDLLIENNKILNSNDNGINIKSGERATIKNNLINNTQQFPGMGKSGDNSGVGIITQSSNNLIEYNQVLNTSYIGIRFGGNNTIVKNNLVDTFCLNKNDGGGIYTFTGSSNQTYYGRKIIGNIIINAYGAREGSNIKDLLSKPQAEGIYLDDNTTGVEISDNTIANISNKGIYLHNARNNTINNNTIYNSTHQLYLGHDQLADPLSDNTITNNLFFSKTAEQANLTISTIKNDIGRMADFSDNYYASPTSDNFKIFNTYYARSTNQVNQIYDLKGWKKAYGKDISSKTHPFDIPAFKVNSLVGTNKYENGTFNSTVNDVTCNSCNSSWAKKLDGGALQVKNSGSSNVALDIGSLTKGKNYLLKFSALASHDAVVKLYLRESGSPWHTVSPTTKIEITQERGEFEALLSPMVSLSKSRLMIAVEEKDVTYWVDNIELLEADVEVINPDDHVLFEYNAGKVDKTITLEGNYVDVKNKTYSGRVTLSPYSSIILIKTLESRQGGSTPTSTVNTGIYSLYLNTGSEAKSLKDGNTFVGDQEYSSFYNKSSTYSNTGASNDPLFQTERYAKSLKFAIPVPNGTYTVKTYHNELYFGKSGPSARAGRRVFDLSLEGKLVKNNFDLFLENANRSTVLVFENVEVKDGLLNLDLLASVNNASISGIAIETLAVTHSLYLNTGSGTKALQDGNTFVGDRKYSSFYNKSSTYANTGSSNDPLFQTERYAKSLKFAIPVPNGTYTVKTYHNELYFGKSGPSARAGRRVFDLSLEGKQVKDNFDIFLENANRSTVLVFKDVEVKDGLLNLELLASANNASISGIAIEGSSNTPNFKKKVTEEKPEIQKEEILNETNTEKISLYPNPARTVTHLAIQTEIQHILIHNMNGQLVRQFDPQMLRNDRGKYTIPLSNIPQGLYLVSLLGSKGMIDQLRLIIHP